MAEALQVRERAERPAAGAGAHSACLRAGYDLRVKSRFVATLADGREIGVVLARGSVLRDGDWLRATDGSLVRVEAAPQAVLCITANSAHALMRIVYHLANRHVPAQIAADYVLIEPDPVLAQMVEHLGGAVEAAHLPFDPEPGAYEGRGAGQSSGHPQDHAHTHGPADHGHPHDHAHGHTHGHHADDFDPVSATVGEQLSQEAHRAALARVTAQADKP